jgi:starch phosphorylase
MKIREFLQTPRIAYLSMEIALRNEIPTYAGGLGILAGDTLRSCADLRLPMVGVTLVSREGHFRQEIDAEGRQIEHPNPWDPSKFATLLDAKVGLEIERRRVWLQGWLYVVEGQWGGRVPVILLDTDVPENEREDREITHWLYGGDGAYRFKQEMVLGLGGLQILRALGFTIRQYHMNEGHSALLGLGLLQMTARAQAGSGRTVYDAGSVRERCVFTTHTPVEAGQDQFPYDLVRRVMGDLEDEVELRCLAGEERLNMTALALQLSGYVNGVAIKHAELSRWLYPGFEIHAVTNGIHPYTWACDPFRKLYNENLSTWWHEPELLVRVDRIPDEAIWEAHLAAKRSLLGLIREKGGTDFREEVPLIGFARRMTGYKRPDLMLTDRSRLRAIARTHPFQVVFAGKAHPRDEIGKRLIQELHRMIREMQGEIPMAFLPNYDMDTARALVSGADLWLNTPLPPLEASGTSGMKAALNGVPNLSILDGWWIEGHIEGVTGWAIESADPGGSKPDGHAEGFYQKLENVVLPLYWSDRTGWIRIMKGAIGKNAHYFNSHRMMRRYATEAYIR